MSEDAAGARVVHFRHSGPLPAAPGFPGTDQLAEHLAPRRVGLPASAFLVLCDTATLTGTVLGAGWIAQYASPSSTLELTGLALMIPVALAINACAGLYDLARAGPIERFRLRLIAGALLPEMTIAVTVLLGPERHPGLLVIPVAAVASIPALIVAEAALRRVMIRRGAWGVLVVLLGEAKAALALAGHLLAHPELGLRPAGFLGELGQRNDAGPLPYLGNVQDAATVARRVQVALVAGRGPEPSALLPFRRVILLAPGADAPSLLVRTRDLAGLLGLELPQRERGTGWSLTRLLQASMGLLLLVLALPVMAAAALAIKLIDPGPVIYTQPRVGLHGRLVPIFKLRSMYRDAEARLQRLLAHDAAARAEWEQFMKLSHDPRVLPVVGRLIRRTSIDELPQLWNVVRGDIGLVGPRPFPNYHTTRFAPEFQELRASVRPGLTGLWQVSERSNADLGKQAAIDAYYIRNRSVWLDLYILARTLPAALLTKGAR